MNKKDMKALALEIAGAIAPAIVTAIATATSQPAATVTNTVVSVAKTGQRRISQAVRDTVKANRVRNGGPLPNLVPAWQLIDDCLCDANGNPIADAQAPTQRTATKLVDMTDKQIMALTKKDMLVQIRSL